MELSRLIHAVLSKDISKNNMTSARVTRRYSAWKNKVFPIVHGILYRIFIKENKFPPLQERCHFVNVSAGALAGRCHVTQKSREENVSLSVLYQFCAKKWSDAGILIVVCWSVTPFATMSYLWLQLPFRGLTARHSKYEWTCNTHKCMSVEVVRLMLLITK